jgi:hypothetical protein
MVGLNLDSINLLLRRNTMIGETRKLKRVVIVTAIALAMLLAGVKTVQLQAQDSKAKVTLSKKQLKDLIANANTPADHERIAQYYDAEAARYEADAKEHEDEASYYAGHQHPIVTGHSPNNYDHYMVSHCPQIATKLKEAAQEARDLAGGHREMAKVAK